MFISYDDLVSMTDIETAGEEKEVDISDTKQDEQLKPHHTINQELDIGTPVYQR